MLVLLGLLPAVLYLALVLPAWKASPWRRSRAGDAEEAARQYRGIAIALGLGVAAALPVAFGVRALGAAIGVDPRAQITGAWASILTTLFLFAPIEEAAKLAVAFPTRARTLKNGWDGVLLGAGVAAGFACVEVAWFAESAVHHGEATVFLVARAVQATIARVFAGSIWGYAIGRARARGRKFGRTATIAFVVATFLRGLYDHLIFGRGLAALLGSIPLFIGIVVVAYLAARELGARPRRARSKTGGRYHSSAPPPSLRTVRDALRRAERPVMLRWIVIGAIVTVGVIVTAVTGAVVLGLSLGVDFGAVDEGEVAGAVPLALIGVGVLLAFPASGYLVARASGADSVLEAALSTGLAIVAALVLLGLAAPVAVVFALAFAPIAFALACAGAWLGIGASS
jgi:RsiW-degrading membrane proteinase PrsW (M82 family)